MRYGPSLTVGVNLALATLFDAVAPYARFAVAVCALIVCGLIVATILCWPRVKPRPKFQLLTFLALLGSTLLWGGGLALVADPAEKLATPLYYLVKVGLFGGIVLMLVAIFLQWAAIRDERERNALP
jgi:carbon starvation protein CstA